ncbi:MAG: hypothetical protein ISR55_02835 [Bacteroidetes bacterium]|nr:hypothetical protein [Bacteroidota bacterium]MBL6962733.1 hypothetical protein [Bacteroidota bacterium]
MKHIIFTISLILILGGSIAQTTKKKTTRTPPPYLLKSVFNEKMTEIDEKLTAVESTTAVLNNNMRKRNDSLYVLKNNIDTIIKILQEYNIKIRLTSDSLTLTSFSISEFRRDTKADIAQLQSEMKSSNRLISLGVLGLAVLLILLVIAFIILNTRINRRLHDLDDNIEEGIEESDVKIHAETEEIRKAIKRELSRDIDLFRYSLESKIKKSHQELSDAIGKLKS